MFSIGRRIVQYTKTRSWQKKMMAVFSSFDVCHANTNGLRLILGPGRSGTYWLSRGLAKTSASIVFLNEPLHPFKIRLPYESKWDHTAVAYAGHLDSNHPLILLYRLLSRPEGPWRRCLPDKIIVRDDPKPKYTLIKEVHSLLATEALLNSLHCPTVLITRNPLYVVDSLLAIRGLRAPIWRTESAYVVQPEFMERFGFTGKNRIIKTFSKFKDQPKDKKGVIIAKTMAVAMINKMLEQLGKEYKNALHIRYEDLCASAVKRFETLAAFLTLEKGPDFYDFINQSQENEKCPADPYSVFRNTREQPNRAFKFLNPEEVKLAMDVLDTCNLL